VTAWSSGTPSPGTAPRSRPVPVASVDRGLRRRGVTLVEVLVALVVLTLNLLGIVSAFALTVRIAHTASAVLAELRDLRPEAACLAVLLGPVRLHRPRRRHRSAADSGALRRARGLTLVELLTASAIAATVILALGAFAATTSRGASSVERRIDRELAEHGLELVFAGDVARAGEGLDPADCGIAIDHSGTRLDAYRRTTPDEEEHVTYTAGTDAQGRPALYRRTAPHPRQPWIEDVTSFTVEIPHVAAGTDPPRLVAVTVVITRRGDGEPLRWTVPLPHRPCLRELTP
jgi:Tfp pilus assembly protein PilV